METLTDEQVLWGAASMLMKRYGHDEPRQVAERIGALAMGNDEAGVALWKAIARCMDALRGGSVQ